MPVANVSASEPHEFNGAYVRQQGEGRTYTYFASIFPYRDGFRWTAEIWCDGRVKGTTAGTLRKGDQGRLASAESQVRDTIMQFIEGSADLTE